MMTLRCPDCGALMAEHAPNTAKPAGSREWRGCPPMSPVSVDERLARMDAQIAAMSQRMIR